MRISRRTMVAFTASVASTAGATQAPRYIIVSMIADRVDIVGASRTTGSRLDQNSRRDIDDSAGAFDSVAAAAAADAITRAEPGAVALVVKMQGARFHDNPELMLQADGVALPGPLVDAIDREKASRLILITKYAGDASIKIRQTSIGVGKLRGVGYYVDTQTTLQNAETGVLGDGFLAPFVYARISLVDTQSGKVMREERIQASELVLTQQSATANHPWKALTPEEKVSRLSGVIRREIERATKALLAAR